MPNHRFDPSTVHVTRTAQSGIPSTPGLAAYSALSLALAMAMLPIYMIAPKFYGDTLGVSLGVLGIALFGVRLIDTVQDPLIGRLVDGLAGRRRGWTWLLVLSAFLLSAGFVLLFHVPGSLTESSIVAWMIACLVLVYTAHSLMNVCYLSWGARLTDDPGGRARVTGWREASGVIGVVIASVLPAVWVSQSDPVQAYGAFAWVFTGILALTLIVTLAGSPRPLTSTKSFSGREPQMVDPFRESGSAHASVGVRQGLIRRLLAPWAMAFGRDAAGEGRWLWRLYGFYLCNATAAALPATLILFYVEDVIERPAYTGLFLGAYFVAGLATLGFWVRVSDRVGKVRTWAMGSLVAGLGLCLAALLGQGDVALYLLVCVLTGCALGVDLALPPAMLADAIKPEQRGNTGLYFGMWALVAKFALAVSAGVSLPMLALLGYVPGDPSSAASLAYVYALMPIVFKILAALCLGQALLQRDRGTWQQAPCHLRSDKGRAKA